MARTGGKTKAIIKMIDISGGGTAAECRGLERLKALLARRRDVSVRDAEKVVQKILRAVREEGDAALCRYTLEFDGVDISGGRMKVSEDEIAKACNSLDQELAGTIRRAADNIRSYHIRQKGNSWFCDDGGSTITGQIVQPVETAGIYVPAGTAPLPSTVLMTAIPAKVAGVKRIVMCTPPGRDGQISGTILAAAALAGVNEIYSVGGAQAVAAMAFGTQTIPAVDVIAGPGNIYVAMAKKAVFGYCGIDMIAGPSEIVVLADRTSAADLVAADMLSQAEHDRMASAILVTDDRKLAGKVRLELERQLGLLSRREIAERSLAEYGLIVITSGAGQSIDAANMIAPEHLEVMIDEPFGILPKIRNAGAVFIGKYSCEPLGDYYAGPSHVLPTGGTSRFFSPLGTDSFMKKTSLIYYSREAFVKAAPDIRRFAAAEGLDAHGRSAGIRLC